MQRRHLDGNVGKSGRMWREASAERFEIGQSSGVELGIDGLREFGFTGAVVSQRQQPDNNAACLLLAVTGKQRLEGALIGAVREELLTIDQIRASPSCSKPTTTSSA